VCSSILVEWNNLHSHKTKKKEVQFFFLICETVTSSKRKNAKSFEHNTLKNFFSRFARAIWSIQFSVGRDAPDLYVSYIQTGTAYSCMGVYVFTPCLANWKNPGVLVEKEYDFVGVRFDHNNKTVRVADKTVNKLPSTPFSPHQLLRTSELERLVSRLIFCSSVVRIILGDYFFLLKWANRQIAVLNNTGKDRDLSLPASVCSALNHWIQRAKSILSLSNNNLCNFDFDVLFVDASTWGWGAYFISSTGECAIFGEKWSEEILNKDGYNINVLEALALEKALLVFEERLLENRNVDIRIDNSSALMAVLKSKSKSSAALNEHACNAVRFLVDRSFSYTLQYVNTKENWADGPSRGAKIVQNPTSQQITEVLCYENRGTLGRQAVNTSVSLLKSNNKKND
jgi:hypothetical protein